MPDSRTICIATLLCAAHFTSPAAARANGFPAVITNGDVVRKVADVPEAFRGDLASVRDQLDAAGIDDPLVAVALAAGGTSIGQSYQQFGLFSLEIWTWGGRTVLLDDAGQVVDAIDAEDAAAILGGAAGTSWRYRFPPGLLAIGGLVGLIVLASFLGRSDEHDAKERYEELMLDDRYRRALDILHEKHDEAEATSGQASESSEEPSDSALEESTGSSGDSPAPTGGSSALQAAALAADHPDEADDDGGFAEAVDFLEEQGIDRTEAQQNLAFLVHVLIAADEAKEAAGVA